MSNQQKQELKDMAKKWYSFERIRSTIDYASDATIKKYIKIFTPKSTNE